MAVVITLSSDSESESEVEILGSYSNKNKTLPLSSVRVEVNALKITTPLPCIDLTNTKLSHKELSIFSGLDTTSPDIVDLTEDRKHFCEHHLSSGSKPVEATLLATDLQDRSKVHFKPHEKYPRNCRKDLEEAKFFSGRGILRSQKPLHTKEPSLSTPVELKGLSNVENHRKELLSLDRVSVMQSGETKSLHLKKDHKNDSEGERSDLSSSTLHKPLTEDLHDKSCQGKTQESLLTHRNQINNFHLEHNFSYPAFTHDPDELSTIPSPACASSSGKEKSLFPKELRSLSPSLPIGTSTVQPLPPESESTNHSPINSVTFVGEDVNSLHKSIPHYESLKSGFDEVTFAKATVSCSQTLESSSSLCRTIDLDEPFPYEEDFGLNSPLSFSFEESKDEEEESSDLYCTSTMPEDKYYVCPAAVNNLLFQGSGFQMDEEDGGRKPQMLCRQSLSMVYSTIDESYHEGTLQLLSDLLQPGFYPPKDITSHLLWGVLLNPQSPHHICVQAFDLLMRTQMYHNVDKWSAPWDWEKLSNVVEKQQHRPAEIMCMFLEYVVQTLEDDFRIKRTTSARYQSLAKEMLSFDHRFSHIRDVCKWLFSTIVRSTDCNEMAGDHTRIVTIFQRMLTLALEVDCSPAICSAKLSLELFHMLISRTPLRPQRMLLLESMQSKLLRCKLLEHLLDYNCPVKASVPMSLSLLLHFLKNCSLSPDPTDGTEKWRRWEELVCHLWMLLLSYNGAMNGYLSGSKTENRVRVGPPVYKPEDMVSKCAIREAVESFLSRSQGDVGGTLPLHVEESLTYLQDHLLDVSQ